MARRKDELVPVEPVEVLPPEVQPVALSLAEAKIQALVQREVAEALVQREGMQFEPWFRSRRVAEEIRRLQTVPERRVSAACYERWGCMICRTTSRPHTSHGMCGRCNALHGGRRKEIKRELLGEKSTPCLESARTAAGGFLPSPMLSGNISASSTRFPDTTPEKFSTPRGQRRGRVRLAQKTSAPCRGRSGNTSAGSMSAEKDTTAI